MSASTRPSEPASPVRSVTRQPSATMKAASPTNEIVWPPQRSRKSRLENATNVPGRASGRPAHVHARERIRIARIRSRSATRAATALRRLRRDQRRIARDRRRDTRSDRLDERRAELGVRAVVAVEREEQALRRIRGVDLDDSRRWRRARASPSSAAAGRRRGPTPTMRTAMSSRPLSIVLAHAHALALEQLVRDPAQRRRAQEDDRRRKAIARSSRSWASGTRSKVARRWSAGTTRTKSSSRSFVTEIPAGVCDSNAVSLTLTIPMSSRPVLTRRKASAVSMSSSSTSTSSCARSKSASSSGIQFEDSESRSARP